MNEIISNLAGELKAAVLGTKPAPKQNPIEVAAAVVCELAMPRIKSAMGSRYAEAKKIWTDGRRIAHLLNFKLTEIAANTAYQNQLDEHDALTTSGGDLVAVTRRPKPEAWHQDFEARRLAATQAAQKIWQKFRPFQIEIGDLLLAELHAQISELENLEAKQASRFGLPYKSSATVAALAWAFRLPP